MFYCSISSPQFAQIYRLYYSRCIIYRLPGISFQIKYQSKTIHYTLRSSNHLLNCYGSPRFPTQIVLNLSKVLFSVKQIIPRLVRTRVYICYPIDNIIVGCAKRVVLRYLDWLNSGDDMQARWTKWGPGKIWTLREKWGHNKWMGLLYIISEVGARVICSTHSVIPLSSCLMICC